MSARTLESTKAGRIVANVPYAVYAAGAGQNVSPLKGFARSALHFKHGRENRSESDALTLGTAAHCATLEPHRFGTDFAVWDRRKENGDMAARTGPKWEEFKAANVGRELITEDQRDAALAIAAAVRACPEAMVYLRHGHAEVSMAWHDAETGTACKGRVDWLTTVNGVDVLVGLKTTRDIRLRKFAAQAADLSYHWQWAYYPDGFERITGRKPREVEIVVESAAPHAVAVYRIPEHVLERGRQEYRDALEQLARCEASGVWPGPVVGEVEFDLPAWAYPADEMTIEDAGDET